MRIDDLSSRVSAFAQDPQLVTSEVIESLEKEIHILMKGILQDPKMSDETYQKYQELSGRIHQIVDLDPHLVIVDQAFAQCIRGISIEETATTSPGSTSQIQASILAAPALVPRPVRDNPINQAELKAWIEAHKNPKIQRALTELSSHIRHISQDEFEGSLQTTIQHLNTFLSRQGGDYVVAVEQGKSNQWVKELAEPFLVPKPKQDISLVFPLFLKEFMRRQSQEPEVIFPQCVVLFDDAAYSGEQLTRVVRGIMTSVNAYNQNPQNEKISMPTVVVASPYMTEFAEKAIKKSVGSLLVGEGDEEHSALEHLEILPYNRMMTIKELIKDQATLDHLTQMWWPAEARLESARPGKQSRTKPAMKMPTIQRLKAPVLEFTKDLSPSQYAHKKGVESRATTYFSFKIPDQESFVGPLSEGKVVINGRLQPEMKFNIIPRTVPPYKPNFEVFRQEIARNVPGE